MPFGRSVSLPRKIRGSFRFALFLSFGSLLAAAKDPLAEPGFQHFYNLEYKEALEAFTAAATAEPNDPGHQVHIAQTVLYYAMYQHGALESDLISATNPLVSRPKLPVTPEQQRLFETSIAKAIELSQARIRANAKDTKGLYSMGVAVGLRANWNYLVNKAWLDPLRDATQARKLHLQATEADAGLYDARLVQGVHDYLIGSLPVTIKLLGFLAGFRGDREEGIRTLRSVVEKGSTNRVDAEVLLSAILRREKRQAQAVPLLLDATSKFPRNYLFRFELAQLYADLGDKTKALEQIDFIEQYRTKNTAGFSQLTNERVEYMRGHLHFLLRDYDRAIGYLQKATQAANRQQQQFEINATAQAWLRLGQAFDAKGKRSEAMNAYRQVMQVGPQTASAREAKDYLSSPFKPRHA